MSGFILDFMMHDLWITLDECVMQMYVAHEKKDEEAFQKAFKDWEKYSQLYRVGKRMTEANYEDWDWKRAADDGNLCENDWKVFGEEIVKAGASREEFDKKWGRESIWKVGLNGKAPDSKSGIL